MQRRIRKQQAALRVISDAQRRVLDGGVVFISRAVASCYHVAIRISKYHPPSVRIPGPSGAVSSNGRLKQYRRGSVEQNFNNSRSLSITITLSRVSLTAITIIKIRSILIPRSGPKIGAYPRRTIQNETGHEIASGQERNEKARRARQGNLCAVLPWKG